MREQTGKTTETQPNPAALAGSRRIQGYAPFGITRLHCLTCGASVIRTLSATQAHEATEEHKQAQPVPVYCGNCHDQRHARYVECDEQLACCFCGSMNIWVPWQLAPDSDPEQRFILVDANDEGTEHPGAGLFHSAEEALRGESQHSHRRKAAPIAAPALAFGAAATVAQIGLSPYQHELNASGTACATDCPACRWVANLEAPCAGCGKAPQQCTCNAEALMTDPGISKAIAALRSAGYAVIMWTPEELKGANPRRVEDRSVELGWEVIRDLKEPHSDSKCEGCGKEDYSTNLEEIGGKLYCDDCVESHSGDLEHTTDPDNV